MHETRARDQIVEVGKSIYERGLTHGSTGNVSLRLDDGWLLTPTNSSLGRLNPARISKLDEAGRLLAGDPPSKELFLHQAVYDERAGAKAVVHLHSTYSVALSCLRGIDPQNALPNLTAYAYMKLGPVPLIGYYRPGDPRLGDAIREHIQKRPAVLLANHGPVVAGKTLEDALYATEELEATAKLALVLRGSETQGLTAAQLTELREVFGLQW